MLLSGLIQINIEMENFNQVFVTKERIKMWVEGCPATLFFAGAEWYREDSGYRISKWGLYINSAVMKMKSECGKSLWMALNTTEMQLINCC